MIAEQRGQERVAEQVFRIVVTHRDLFEHYLPLDIDVRGSATPSQHDVGDKVNRHRKVVVDHVRVETGVFLRRECIEFAAHTIHDLRDVQRRP